LIHIIEYQHIGGPRKLTIKSIFELSVILETLIDDPEVLDHTIKINSEEAQMARVRFQNVEPDTWYKIILFADHAKQYGRKHTDEFEAKFDGQWWVDQNGMQISVYAVYRIDDELAF